MTGLVLVHTGEVVVAGGQFGMVWTVNLEVNRRGLLVQLNRFLKFPLPEPTQIDVLSVSSALSKSQVRCQKLKYAGGYLRLRAANLGFVDGGQHADACRQVWASNFLPDDNGLVDQRNCLLVLTLPNHEHKNKRNPQVRRGTYLSKVQVRWETLKYTGRLSSTLGDSQVHWDS